MAVASDLYFICPGVHEEDWVGHLGHVDPLALQAHLLQLVRAYQEIKSVGKFNFNGPIMLGDSKNHGGWWLLQILRAIVEHLAVPMPIPTAPQKCVGATANI